MQSPETAVKVVEDLVATYTVSEDWCGEGDLNPHGIAPASTSS